MLTPQFLLPIHRELVIDLFAGGGGASTGIEQAIGRPVDIAINHNLEAVAMHLANHPQTKHYVSDVFEVDPLEVVDGRPVGMLWASPDCKHFSKAKGGKPVSKKIRGLAWVVVKWAKLVRPRVIFLENVEEFQTWGPLGPDDRPCPKRKGRTFQRWKSSLKNLGYEVGYKEDRASDLGTPTIRKRLYLIARCDGEPIVFPEHTYGPPDSLPVKARKLKPFRTAAECIDWSDPAPSIFERKRELADATKRRIAKGIFRYVIDAKEPFIVPLTHQGGDRVEAVSEPFGTITGAQRGEKALCIAQVAPLLTEHANASTQRTFAADEPLRTQCGEVKGGHFALVSAFLAQHNNHRGTVPSDGRPATAPISTITASGSQQGVVTAALVGVGARAGQSRPRGVDEPIATTTAKYDTALMMANLVHMGPGEEANGKKRWSHGVRDIADPLNTVTASGMAAGLVTSNLIKLRGTSKEGQSVTEPLHTISAQGLHHAEVRAFLLKYYGTDQDPKLTEPLHTVTTKHRFGLVTVKGQPYAIVDIGLRMLKRRELFRANGFKDNYIIEWGIHPVTGQRITLTNTVSIRLCGNCVCPPMAEAYVRANYRDQQPERMAA